MTPLPAASAVPRVETRELAYFVAVAEELHFTRAAQRLGIAAPPLSRAIALLERRVGVQLLERTSRRVALTAAGQVFLDDARAALGDVHAAVTRARSAAAQRRLSVAVLPGSGIGLLAQVLDAAGPAPHAADVQIVFTHDQLAALRDGTADVALVCGHAEFDGLASEPLTETEPVALLPAHHRLARRRRITTAQLSAEPDYQPEPPAVAMDELLDLIALGRLVTVVGRSATERMGPRVAAVPVSDLPHTTLHLAWRPERTRIVARFLRAARQAVASAGPTARTG